MDDYVSILQNTLEYIDKHLGDALDVEHLAQHAGFSPYHFCRVFRFGTGQSVMGYVRSRRLLCAAVALSGQDRLIDIALQYGFETHSGFSKAFRRHFGCTPENFRIHAKAFPPPLPDLNTLKQSKRRNIVMEPTFITRPAIKIAGYSLHTTNVDGVNNTAIPQFWTDYLTDGRCKKLHEAAFVQNHAEYGACFPENPQTGEFVYAIGVEVQDGSEVPAELETFDIPAATYAVFLSPPASRAAFSDSIQSTWQHIYSQWFPQSGYEYAPGCVDYELYDERCMGDTGCVCAIYIPVVKKNT